MTNKRIAYTIEPNQEIPHIVLTPKNEWVSARMAEGATEDEAIEMVIARDVPEEIRTNRTAHNLRVITEEEE